MQDYYVLIGGQHDGLNVPAHYKEETFTCPIGVSGQKELYHRLKLELGYASIEVYVHESLTPTQALNNLVEYYRGWAYNRPGGGRRSR
jgi:hypothetical protein